MIINDLLNEIFSTKNTVKVLRELEKRNIGFTGRKIATFSKITHQSAHNILTNLEALKIVKREFVGNAHLFKLEKDNYIYKNILKPLFKSESKFKQNIIDLIKKEIDNKVVSGIIYGSVARKEEITKSNLDVCFVYKKHKVHLENRVMELKGKLFYEYGVILSPFYISLSEFSKRAKMSKPPINSILKDGIVIYGKKIKELYNG